MANWTDEVLLQGEFTIVRRNRALCKVTLIPSGIFYSQISPAPDQYKEQSVQICDVLGCHCNLLTATSSTTSTSQDESAACFTVFAYPLRKKLLSGQSRHREEVTFEVDSCSTLEENRAIALKWKNVISCLSRGLRIKGCDVERCVPPPWGTFLVLVNPHSGPGRAMQIFKEQVEPMLAEAGIPFKLVVTDYAGHAHDLMQNLQLSEWAAVVIVSGDGLVHEVINGLMQRVDWTAAIKTPLGCLPGGSGNALVCSVSYAAGEPVQTNMVLHATFVLIKHKVVPMDLVLVQTPSKQSYSFLSLTWGLVADVDFESEKYRYLGEMRFTVGVFSRFVNLRVYPGTLSFLPVAEYVPKTGKSVKMLKRIRRFFLESTSRSSSMDGMSDKPFSEVFTDGKAHDSENGSDAHFSSEADTVFDRQTSRVGSSTDVPETCVTSAAVINSASASGVLPNTFQPESRQQSSNMHNSANGWDSAVNTNTSSCSETGVMHQCKRRLSGTMSRYEEVEEEVMYASKHKGQPVPTPLLPPLDQPVPDDWVVIKDKFVMFCALYQTHLGSDLLTVPSARLADGVIHLMFVREGVSRASLLRILTSFSSGAHIDLPDVEMVPVLAFRLEPEKSEGHIMVDGEQMEPEPLQCQVLPGLGRIMAIQ